MSDPFLSLLLTEVETRRVALRRALRAPAPTDVPDLARAVRDHWHPLPAPGPIVRAAAVDASAYCADLASGAHLLIAQAVLVGDGGLRDQAVTVAGLPAHVPAMAVEAHVRHGMRALELDLAAASLARASGRTLYLDGAMSQTMVQALHADTPHPPADVSPPDDLVGRVERLYRAAPAAGVRLLSIAKTYRSTLLQTAYAPRLGPRVGDAAALDAWTAGCGHTTPIMLGRWVDDVPGRVSPARRGRGSELLSLPAIVAMYVRLAPGGIPLRVEMLAPDAGLPVRYGEASCRPVEIDPGPVLSQLRADYVDDVVYNVPLVAADATVRLHRREAVRRYVPLIAGRLALSLALDRSRRRFDG